MPAGVLTTILATADSAQGKYGTVLVSGVDFTGGIAIDANGALYVSVCGEKRVGQSGHWDAAILKITPNGDVVMFAGLAVKITAANGTLREVKSTQ